MLAIATLVQDDPYLSLPKRERIAARRDRKAKLFKPAFNIAPSMTDPTKAETESVFTISGWIKRQKQIPLPATTVKTLLSALTVLDIQIVTCKYYGVKLEDVLSRSRCHPVIIPRQVSMYLAQELTGKSTLKIGRFCGGRDHATALYSIQKIERLAKSDPVLAQDIATIRAALVGEQI
jgi:chromosomal replication initiation ATPase DnaA